jgi:hypothetical protein
MLLDDSSSPFILMSNESSLITTWRLPIVADTLPRTVKMAPKPSLESGTSTCMVLPVRNERMRKAAGFDVEPLNARLSSAAAAGMEAEAKVVSPRPTDNTPLSSFIQNSWYAVVLSSTEVGLETKTRVPWRISVVAPAHETHK